MEIANNWKDYEILDMADGEKLERWNNVILIRPDIIEVILVEEHGNIIKRYLKNGK